MVGVLADISLVLLLRLSGRQMLSKMNAFDLVVTVALGSTFATILLNRDVSRAEGGWRPMAVSAGSPMTPATAVPC